MFQKQEAGSGAVTPVQAVTTALAATVGTGNIVGTSQAIALGGYGAVFWLWLAALLGMMIKYSEVVLSIRFRERDAKGDWVGGPMYYVKNGLGKGWQWVGILFAVFAAIACFGIGNMSQVNSIVGSLNNAIDAFILAAEGERNLLDRIFGIAIAALVALILFGGIKRIGAVAGKAHLPFMSVLYIVFAIVVVFAHAGNIGPAFAKIFFVLPPTPGAVGGAAAGVALKQNRLSGACAGARLQRGRPRLGGHRAGADGGGHEGAGSAGPLWHLRGLCRYHRHLHADGADHHLQRRGDPVRRIRQLGADHQCFCDGFWHEIRLCVRRGCADALRVHDGARLVALWQPLCAVSVRPEVCQGLSGCVHHRDRDRRGREA